MRAVIILTVKNEGAFLLEWLAHHLTLGFSHVLAFSNDCSDGTDVMLDRLQSLGHVTHIRNSGLPPEGPQWAALKQAERHAAVKGADWVLCADVDEFVNIHVGDRSLRALTQTLPDADAITLTWRLFGNQGIMNYQDKPVTEVFTRCAPAMMGWPWRGQMFKTLYRPQVFRKPGVHRPRSPRPGMTPSWFDGSGRRFEPGERLYSDYRQTNYELVQLNHYALGSLESFIVKCDRGRANREASTFDIAYWIERNLCDVSDVTIQATQSAALRQDLLSDPILGPLHQKAVAWRRNRFANLMQGEAWREFYFRLLMCRPSRSLTPEEASLIRAHFLNPQGGS